MHTVSVRQALVADHMIGWVMTAAQLLAWSAMPLGAIARGLAHRPHTRRNIDAVYVILGLLLVLSAGAFVPTGLRRVDGQAQESASA